MILSLPQFLALWCLTAVSNSSVWLHELLTVISCTFVWFNSNFLAVSAAEQDTTDRSRPERHGNHSEPRSGWLSCPSVSINCHSSRMYPSPVSFMHYSVGAKEHLDPPAKTEERGEVLTLLDFHDLQHKEHGLFPARVNVSSSLPCWLAVASVTHNYW